MKKVTVTSLIIIFLTSIISCKKGNNEENSFYNPQNRIGLWISPDQKDTLNFTSNTDLIRKGLFFKYEKYQYRIDGKKLFIRLPNPTIETEHPILWAEGNRVILGNIYISTGFVDNSGIFIKAN